MHCGSSQIFVEAVRECRKVELVQVSIVLTRICRRGEFLNFSSRSGVAAAIKYGGVIPMGNLDILGYTEAICLVQIQ